MGRRLTQAELIAQFKQTVTELGEQLDQPRQSLEVLGAEDYADQFGQRQLGGGRTKGVYEAWTLVANQSRWGPVGQARAHDALTQRISEVWAERAEILAEQATRAGYETHVRETLDLPNTGRGQAERARAAVNMNSLGHLDALQAASAAIAGFPERLQALADLAHPERARQLTRDRGRKRDRGQGLD